MYSVIHRCSGTPRSLSRMLTAMVPVDWSRKMPTLLCL